MSRESQQQRRSQSAHRRVTGPTWPTYTMRHANQRLQTQSDKTREFGHMYLIYTQLLVRAAWCQRHTTAAVPETLFTDVIVAPKLLDRLGAGLVARPRGLNPGSGTALGGVPNGSVSGAILIGAKGRRAVHTQHTTTIQGKWARPIME
jgi:hypothetical protein